MTNRLLLLVLTAGCLEKAANVCSDGVVCPLDKVCIPGGCALPEQVASCDGQPEGASCTFAGVAGQCEAGLCLGVQCGNGDIDEGEICDDGNTTSGDGCRADCAKVEVCGDGVVDEGEPCDDGNTNPADGCDACQPQGWAATAIVGGMASATNVGLDRPTNAVFDARGNMYVADTDGNRVYRVDEGGVVTLVAGTGAYGFSGDGGSATNAVLNAPMGLAVDGLGNLFIADSGNGRVRRVDRTGVITTVAGTGTVGGVFGDGGVATAAGLSLVNGVTVDGLGNLYVAAGDRIRMIDTTGIITTIAGTAGGYSGDGGPATAAQLNDPDGVLFDATGRMYIIDDGNNRIRRVELDGTITTVAGASSCSTSNGYCSGGYSGDNGPATSALLDHPSSMLLMPDGRIVIADAGNDCLRQISTTGTITKLAGTCDTYGFAGDGGPATAALFYGPASVALSPTGALVFADAYNNRVRSIAPGGTVTTIVGSGTRGYNGDGSWGTTATLSQGLGVAADASGNVYFADQTSHRVRKVSPDGVVTTIAGTGDAGYRATDDGGPATQALLSQPTDVALDAAGNLYISDTNNHRIRKIDAAGTITTVAGSGATAYDGDDAPATTKALLAPEGITFDTAGNLYIADSTDQRIRRVDPAGIITTVAGSGISGFGGDNNLATSAKLSYPSAVAWKAGELYIDDFLNARIRVVDTTGKIHTYAGTGTPGFTGDGGNATTARLGNPRDIAFDGAGNLLIADTNNGRVRVVDSAGKIDTLYGTDPTPIDNDGDGGPASAASLGLPAGLALDGSGHLFVGTREGQSIRRIDIATGIVTTVVGDVDPHGVGPLATGGRFVDPSALAVTPGMTLAAGGRTGTLQLFRNGAVEVAAGRYLQPTATANLARFRDAAFGSIEGIALDEANGVAYVTESSANRIQAITLVDPTEPRTWTIAPLANTAGTAGYANGAASTARFRQPTGLWLDATAHVLYVADTGNHAIRAIDLTTSTVSTIAGVPATRGFFGDGGPATSALLYAPRALTRCANGDLFIADTGNHRVRRVSGTTISSVLGDGIAASSGEGNPSSQFPVSAPRGLACDARGNVYVTSSTSVRMLPANDQGTVDGTGNVQTIYGSAPRLTFPASVTNCLSGVVAVDDVTVRVADSCTGLLVELVRGPL